MGKRWGVWMGIGGLAAIALLALLALKNDTNRADAARLRAIEEIALHYGFTRVDKQEVRATADIIYTFSREPMDSKSATEMFDKVKLACPTFRFRHDIYDDNSRLVSSTTKTPRREVFLLFPPKDDETWISLIDLVPNEEPSAALGPKPKAVMIVALHERAGIWKRAKKLFGR